MISPALAPDARKSERAPVPEGPTSPGTPSDPVFAGLAEFAALTFNTPIVVISLVDRDRKSSTFCVGLDIGHFAEDSAFYRHAIRSNDVLVVRDPAVDARFSHDPLVSGPPAIRFYAGAPLIAAAGDRLGTVGLFDTATRAFTEADVSRLQAFANTVMQVLVLRHEFQEREQIAISSAQQTELLKLAEDMAGVGTWAWDVATDRTTWSDQLYHIHGYAPGVEPPALQGILAQYHPDDSTVLAEHIRRAVADGLDYALAARIVRPDGAERHVVARGACRKDANGTVTALVGTFQDITDHVTAERFIRCMTDNLPGMVGYWDADLRCRFANAAYEEWFGRSPERMLSTTLPELLGSELFAKNSHHVRAALNGERQVFLRTIVKPSGEVSYTQTHYIPNIDVSGRTQGFYVLGSDCTALKQTEEKLLEIGAQRENLIDELTASNATRGNAVRQLGKREIELQRTSLRHRQLINGVRDYAIYWLDPAGCVESWNIGAQRMKGYVETEIVGQHFSTFFSADDRASGEPERILATALRDGKCIDEGWRIRKDGSSFWSEVSVEAVYDDAAALIGYAKVSRDVSERRAMERHSKEAHDKLQEKSQALSEANRLLLMAEEVSRVGHWRLDVVGYSLLWSDAVCAIHGRPAGYAPRLEAAIDAYHPDDRSAVQEHIDQAITSGKAFSFEARIVRTDGAVRQIRTWGRTETGSDESVIGMFGVIQDVTDRLEAEAQGEDRKERFRLLTEQASDMISLHDLSGNCLFMSPSVRAVLGYDPFEVHGRRMSSLVHAEDHAIVDQLQADLTARGAGAVSTARFRMTRRDGSLVWMEAAARIAEYQHAPRVIFVSRDVTYQVRVETELKAARVQAENAGKAKSSFLANMSHEIRTPMNGVIGFTELLLDSALSDQQRRQAEMIADSGRAMMRLLNDILDLSKVEAGQMTIANEPFDLWHALRACMKLVTPALEKKGLEPCCDIAEDLPKMMRGDGLRLRQILLNLLGNATKFTADGSVTLRASASASGRAVQIEVADTGIGIPKDRQASVFEQFVQADGSIASRFGGTGLGLAISTQLANLMGGSLRLESEPGRGTTFFLELPLVAVTNFDVPASVQSAPPSTVMPARPGVAQARVLVAEDHDVNRMLMSDMLDKLGYRYVLAGDGVEAIAMVAEAERSGDRYAVVLMDMQMPNIDGLEATRRIRQSGLSPSALPIVALTANAYADDVAVCLDAGMQAHLAKPVALGDLAAALRRWAVVPVAPGARLASVNPIKPAIEERYRARRTQALEALGAMVRQGRFDAAEITDVAEMLHKLAGTAAMFGEEALGDEARLLEAGLDNWSVADRPVKVAQAFEAIKRVAAG